MYSEDTKVLSSMKCDIRAKQWTRQALSRPHQEPSNKSSWFVANLFDNA